MDLTSYPEKFVRPDLSRTEMDCQGLFGWKTVMSKYVAGVSFNRTGSTGFFLFGNKKKQKLPSENFSFQVSAMDLTSYPEKFVRPDSSRTEMDCQRLFWAGNRVV